MRRETLETKVLKRIDRKRGDVFLRVDFEDLGGYDQVGRALRALVRQGRLVRVGQGLYAPVGRSQAASRFRREGLRRCGRRLAGLGSRLCGPVWSAPTTPARQRKCRTA